MLSRELPLAAAGGLLDEVRRAGQPVLRRTCGDGDLNVDDGEADVDEPGSEVAEKDAAAVVPTRNFMSSRW